MASVHRRTADRPQLNSTVEVVLEHGDYRTLCAVDAFVQSTHSASASAEFRDLAELEHVIGEQFASKVGIQTHYMGG